MNKKAFASKIEPFPAERAATKQGSGALGRGLMILETLVAEVYPLSAAEVAQRCDLDVSTTHRLLQSLCEADYVLRDDASKRYLASPKTLFPQQLYHPANVIRRAAIPPLTAIRDELGHTAGFIFYYMGERVLAELVPGRDQLSPYYSPWLDSPLHASGGGKVMLMELGERERLELLGPPPWKAYTEKTMVTEEELFADLEASRERGYVVARDDYLMGYSVVAAPVRNTNGAAIGCFFVTGQSQGFPESGTPAIGRTLIQQANLFATTPALQGMAQVLRLA